MSVSGTPAVPDYDLEPMLDVSEPAQLRAAGHRLRQRILGLLGERAATTAELAAALDRPKGTVGHHVHVLADARLIRIVRTRQVRGVVAKYYGRTARTFVLGAAGKPDAQRGMLQTAMEEAVPEHDAGTMTLRHARIPRRRVREWVARVHDLAEEFVGQEPGGDEVFALIAGVYLTDWRTLPDTAEDEETA